MTGVEVLFALLGVIAIGSGLLVAVSTNLVHCALWLVVTLGALAGCYLLLAAEFVAWVQVLIYMGAVVVLLLFALMLTRAPTGAAPDLTSNNRVFAALVAAATAGLLITCFAVAFEDAEIRIGADDIGDPSSIGATLFGSWVLAFELLSVILLAALIGAIVLSRRAGGVVSTSSTTGGVDPTTGGVGPTSSTTGGVVSTSSTTGGVGSTTGGATEGGD